MIAFTWGGIQFAWSSVQVLVPLILGLVGLACFMAYEVLVAEHPIVSIHNHSCYHSLNCSIGPILTSIDNY